MFEPQAAHQTPHAGCGKVARHAGGARRLRATRHDEQQRAPPGRHDRRMEPSHRIDALHRRFGDRFASRVERAQIDDRRSAIHGADGSEQLVERFRAGDRGRVRAAVARQLLERAGECVAARHEDPAVAHDRRSVAERVRSLPARLVEPIIGCGGGLGHRRGRGRGSIRYRAVADPKTSLAIRIRRQRDQLRVGRKQLVEFEVLSGFVTRRERTGFGPVTARARAQRRDHRRSPGGEHRGPILEMRTAP